MGKGEVGVFVRGGTFELVSFVHEVAVSHTVHSMCTPNRVAVSTTWNMLLVKSLSFLFLFVCLYFFLMRSCNFHSMNFLLIWYKDSFRVPDVNLGVLAFKSQKNVL